MHKGDHQVRRFDVKKIQQEVPILIITVYHSPADYPGQWLARVWDGAVPTRWVSTAQTLDELREAKPPEMIILPRIPEDVRVLAETWI